MFAKKFRVAVIEALPLTVSAGVAEARESDTPESLLARADAALYRAKSAGRNCVYRNDGVLIEPAAASSVVAAPA